MLSIARVRISRRQFAVAACGVVEAAQRPPGRAPVEAVVVERGPEGFHPRELVRKNAGKFFLFLRVNLGPGPVAVRLDNEAGAAVKQANLPNRGKRWGELIDVRPGKYFLRAPGRSNATLQIIVP